MKSIYFKIGITFLIAIYTCCSGGIKEEEPHTDTTPPSISNGSPSGELNTGTIQTTISVTTDENATCKYSTSQSTNFSSMPSTFSTTGDTSHSTVVTGLQDENSYNYYVRCQDESNNANASDYDIAFSIPISVVADGDLNIPLTISDTAAINRTSEPVTSGIPLPESANITTINQLMVTNSQNNNIPAQFTVLARWNGTPDDISKPIKWVLLDFQADVSANNSATYYLKSTSDGGNTTNPNLSVQNNADNYVINTGKAKYQINKNYFNLFDYVYIDSNNNGQLDNEIVSQPNQGGVVLTDKDGKQYTALLEAPEVIEIEEQGPMRTVINIRGVFKAQDGTYFAPSTNNPQAADIYVDYPMYSQPYASSFVYYNCRLHFYNNKDYVKIFFTFENNGAQGFITPESYFAPRQVVYFNGLKLVLNTTLAASDIYTDNFNTELNLGDTFTIFQGWKENALDPPYTLDKSYSNGMYYNISNNGLELSNGHTHPGWVNIQYGENSIGFAMVYFWQNFYKAITVSNNILGIELWPSEGYYPFNDTRKEESTYLLSGGRHKTHEFILSFNQMADHTITKTLSTSIKYPLMAVASPNWYTQTKALGLIAPNNLVFTNPDFNEAYQRYDLKQRSMLIQEDSSDDTTMLNIRTSQVVVNGGSSRKWKYWGWMNFGDYLWKMGVYGNGHGDSPYSILLHYIRTQERIFFDASKEMIRHRYDIDQYHGDRVDIEKEHHRSFNYFQRFEQTKHSDNTGNDFISKETYGEGDEASIIEYTWNSSLMLYYFLTGDKKALESIEEISKGLLNHYGDNGERIGKNICTDGFLNKEIHSIILLVNSYRVQGDLKYLEIAKKIAINVILYREQQLGGSGHLGNGKNRGTTINYCLKDIALCKEAGCSNCSNVDIFDGNLIEALINLHQESNDPSIRELIIRMSDFINDKLLFGGIYKNAEEYYPLLSVSHWLEEDPTGIARNYKGILLSNAAFSDCLAYAYQLTNDTKYLDKARNAFKDELFYSYGVGFFANNTINPYTRANFSYKSFSTKGHARMGRHGQTYLYTEWLLQQNQNN